MANEMHKPVLEGKGATDYERYLRTDDLLSLQTVTEDFHILMSLRSRLSTNRLSC